MLKKIRATYYLIDGSVKSIIEYDFIRRNVFRYEQVFLHEKFNFNKIKLNWYTIYDYNNFTLKKIKSDTGDVICEGKMTLGSWEVEGQEFELKFSKHIKFNGFDAIEFTQLRKINSIIERKIIAVNNSVLSDWFDSKVIIHLPFSSNTLNGLFFEDYGIIAEQYVYFLNEFKIDSKLTFVK